MALADASVIRQAIRHPEPEVRETAVRYFTEIRSGDPAVMTAVIAAVRELGHTDGWRLLDIARDLPQTAATLDWALQELAQPLDRDEIDEDNYHYALAHLVAEASPELLRARRDTVAAIDDFPPDLRAVAEARLRLDEASWDECWAEFEALGREVLADDSDGMTFDQRRSFDHLIEALARHGEGHEKLVLDLVRRQFRRAKRELHERLEPQILQLAGEMRLTRAIPRLLAHLAHEEEAWTADRAMLALRRIGGDAVVQAIARAWWDADPEARSGMAEVLGHIPTELSAERVLAFLQREEVDFVCQALAHAALNQFNLDAIEAVVRLVDGDANELDREERDLRLALVEMATITGERFAQYERWYAEAQEASWGWRNSLPSYRLSDGPGALLRAMQADDDCDRVYQIKVTLRDIDPPIWRRLRVPDGPLDDLHEILQDAFSWERMHLYAFRVGDVSYTDPELMEGEHEGDATEVWLSDLIGPGDRLSYVYDFGDNWEHEIVIEEMERIAPGNEPLYVAVCMEGARAAPPEDVGGVFGYAEFLDALADPDHEEHEDMREWIGGGFDPEAVDLDAINKELRATADAIHGPEPDRD